MEIIDNSEIHALPFPTENEKESLKTDVLLALKRKGADIWRLPNEFASPRSLSGVNGPRQRMITMKW
jgi:hypothetical protein